MTNTTLSPDGYITLRVSVSLVTRLNTLAERLRYRASEVRGVQVSRSAVVEELLDCWDENHPNESSQPQAEKPEKAKRKAKGETP
jgi:hypothetical protein